MTRRIDQEGHWFGERMRSKEAVAAFKAFFARKKGDGKRRSFAAVIASVAKQSIAPHQERMDCFATLAMTLKHLAATSKP
jgi:hypothetical protein